MTLDELRKICPESTGRAELFAQPLAAAMLDYGITTARRQAAFLAQVAEESGQLRYTKEIASGEAYEGRADLGNTQPGDGVRFPGRGLLMATGRGMYERLNSALGIDCITSPSLLEIPYGASRSAAYIWAIEKKLNELADADKFFEITHRINGGYTGGDARLAYYLVARKVFGL
jgi:putative chitinase